MQKNNRKNNKLLLLLLGFAVITTCLLGYINKQKQYQSLIIQLKRNAFDIDAFRNMEFEDNSLSLFFEDKCCKNTDCVVDEKNDSQIQKLTTSMLLNHFSIDMKNGNTFKKLSDSMLKRITETTGYQQHFNRYQTILSDIKYFPVAQDVQKKYTVSYDNSWSAPRTYGGKRKHEGTDIMANCNKRGIYPIVSVTDGVVENKGWLEQGGYRIGIRSKHGGYYYYAHLHSYAKNVEIGDEVIAGQLLGFMGDTGYSKKEGTTGNFDVHLHFGIYYNEGDKETSVNPYFILKYLDKYKILYKQS